MRKILLFLAMLGIYYPNVILSKLQNSKKIESQIEGAVMASAIGDAMGRVTEFIPSVDAIFKRYPNGIRTFDDFVSADWQGIPGTFSKNKIAPYTDDTRMAKLVLEVVIKARKQNWDMNQAMEALAQAFVKDMRNDTYGWAAGFRAPGKAVMQGVKELESRIKAGQTKRMPKEKTFWKRISRSMKGWLGFETVDRVNWWDVGDSQAGGCGSVMRAYPFGLVFADDPEKAKTWAAEHSKLTHGHPMTRAACAAMAVGMAYVMQGKDPAFVINEMIKAAEEYDSYTASKMKDAVQLAEQARKQFKQFNFDDVQHDVQKALADAAYRAFHVQVFTKYQGWAADDAIAATVYVFKLYPRNVMAALYTGIHTPGDSDSIGAMAGALIGGYAGVNTIPKKLRDQVEDAKELATLARQVA